MEVDESSRIRLRLLSSEIEGVNASVFGVCPELLDPVVEERKCVIFLDGGVVSMGELGELGELGKDVVIVLVLVLVLDVVV